MLNDYITHDELKFTSDFFNRLKSFGLILEFEYEFDEKTLTYIIFIRGYSDSGKIICDRIFIHTLELYMYVLELIDNLKRWSIWFKKNRGEIDNI